MNDSYVERVVDPTDPDANRIRNMTVEEARARIAEGSSFGPVLRQCCDLALEVSDRRPPFEAESLRRLRASSLSVPVQLLELRLHLRDLRLLR
jgi:hypothetical protein